MQRRGRELCCDWGLTVPEETVGNKQRFRVWIPKSLITSVLEVCHDSPLCGHQGMFKTYKRLHDVAFWPRMWDEVTSSVRSCKVCQTRKRENQKPSGRRQQTEVNHPNEIFRTDIMGPLPRSPERNEHLPVLVDYYTRWVEVFPMHTASSSRTKYSLAGLCAPSSCRTYCKSSVTQQPTNQIWTPEGTKLLWLVWPPFLLKTFQRKGSWEICLKLEPFYNK